MFRVSLIVVINLCFLQLALSSDRHLAERAQTYYQAITRASKLCPERFDKRSYILQGELDEGWKYHKGEILLPETYLNCLGQGICKNGRVPQNQITRSWGLTQQECLVNKNDLLKVYDSELDSVNELDTIGLNTQGEEVEAEGAIEGENPSLIFVTISLKDILWLLLGISIGALLASNYLNKASSAYSSSSMKVRRPEL